MPATQFSFGSRQLDLSLPRVMGILNVTPDSFSDGGELVESGKVSLQGALRRAQAMVEAGADIIDVGGESTRPGAAAVSSQEEIDRVLPVLEVLRENLDVVLSVDTSNPALIRLCAQAGAGLINDVRSLEREGALQAVIEAGLAVCLMHRKGEPATMQQDPYYENVTREVHEYLAQRVLFCENAGLSREKILLDPGFGFGKDLSHNLQLLSRLDELQGLNLPILIGLSRKRMIGTLTNRPAKERVAGSVAAAVIGVMKGARIVRVHDVAETVDAVKVCAAVLREGNA